MIRVYVDESGTHRDSKVLVVAAYVGTSDEWASAEARFRRADKYSRVPFHAVDCAQGGKKFQGMDKDKRSRIYSKIIKIVNDHDVFGVSSSACIDHYEEVFPRNGQAWEEWLQSPFCLVFQMVMVDVAKHVHGTYPGEKFSVAMEDSQHWYVPAAKKFLKMKHDNTWPHHRLLETIAPYSKKDAPQLYAPDVLAYESYLLKLRERFPTKHGMRTSMMTLLRKPMAGFVLDRTTFQFLQARIRNGTALRDSHLEDISARELSRLNRKQF